MGLSFLVEWLVDARRTMPVREYAIVLVILAVIVGWGLLSGVALGLVWAVVLFAVSYSRTDFVRQTLTGAEFRSNVDRPPVEAEELRALGEQVHILRLQGFMFFGTASGLLEHIRSRIEDRDRPPVRFLVLDFRRVSGVDSSAVLAFRKVMQLAKVEGAEVVFTALPDQVRTQLEQGGVRQAELPMSFEPDLDRGVQRCEDALLAGRPAAVSADPTRLWAELGGGGSDLEERIGHTSSGSRCRRAMSYPAGRSARGRLHPRVRSAHHRAPHGAEREHATAHDRARDRGGRGRSLRRDPEERVGRRRRALDRVPPEPGVAREDEHRGSRARVRSPPVVRADARTASVGDAANG